MINISKNIGKGQVNLLCYQVDKNNSDGNLMKIQEIEITDIGGIPYLKLDNLDPHMNIICGENGVGKTNILNSMAYLFSELRAESVHVVKKRAGAEGDGIILLSFVEDNGDSYESKAKIDVFMPEDHPNIEFSLKPSKYKYLSSKKGIYVKVNRVFEYNFQESIKRDPLQDLYGRDVIRGIDSNDLKSWFISRDLFEGKGYLSLEQKHNLQLAKKFIGLLDSNYSFSRVDTDHELMIESDTGEIYLEYLSSGFKSIFFILLGIIKEIEFKHGKDYVKADEYSGVILIDEIELHLHPEWQSKIIKILKESFPSAQFFIATHSPHVVQSAQHNEIIALEKTNSQREGIPFEVAKRNLPDSPEYGFQGWTIEEILSDVMGMKNTRGEAYEEQIEKFDAALDDNDKERAQEAYLELDKMIHPDSHVRKMLKIQMAGLR